MTEQSTLGTQHARAVIDNGSFGTREVIFPTGRLARQPVGATRGAYVDGQWVAFPTHTELERATFDMVVAGRALADGDVAIMMVEAEATEHTVALVAGGAPAPTEEVVASGLEAAKPAIRELCRAQDELAAVAAKPVSEFPVFLEYGEDVFDDVSDAVRGEVAEALR